MRRSPSRSAPSFDALPVVPKPRVHAGVEVAPHRRAPQPMRRSGAIRCATADAGGGHLGHLGRGRIDHVREPGAVLRPPVLGEQLPRRAPVALAAHLGVDLLVEVGVQPHLVVVGRQRGELVEQRELVDVHTARREARRARVTPATGS